MTDDSTRLLTSAAGVERAAARIDPVFRHTPQFVADALVERLGFEVVLKLETLNPIRSFKGRGADYLLVQDEDGAAPLACASAGNFGQGLAYAGARRGREVHVWASEDANPFKLRRMRQLGATVHVDGAEFDAAKELARAEAARRGWRFVEDGREREIAEGAGTLALELTGGFAELTHAFVPVGNGSLMIGVARWLKAAAPATRVIAVGAQGAPAMYDAWRSGRPEAGGPQRTIADGIAARVPVPEAMAELGECIDDFLLVDDEVIVEAMRLLFFELGVVAEPAGAAGLAAALADGDNLAGARVAVPVCGSNMGEEQLRRWLS